MNQNEEYAEYMLAWLEHLSLPKAPELEATLVALKEFWHGNKSVNIAKLKEQLWSWVDSNGGSRISPEKHMLMARMILCLADEDNRELEDIGFFDDLLFHFGIPRKEINKYSRGNPPRRT